MKVREKNRGGGKYDLCKIEIRHMRELMDERDKALKLQAVIYEEKEKAKVERINKLEEAGYVTKSFLWTAIVALAGLIYFLLNYFKK